jgi:GNAT superfamily N-acetyltransferase
MITANERIDKDEYIDFLKRTDLGNQYPEERFEERISRLVKNASISMVSRNEVGQIIGVCFGITDFAYWLFITDLGVDRLYVNRGIGKALIMKALEEAGGEKDIAMYTCYNDQAIGFYEKIGMTLSDDIMQYKHIEWTEFTVK